MGLKRRLKELGHDIEKMNLIEVEVPSHRQALSNVWREGCNRMFAEQNKKGKLITLRGISMKKTTVSLAAVSIAAVVGAVIVIACLMLFSSSTGGATDNLERNKLTERALANAREFIPEAETVEEDPDYGNDLTAAFWVRDDGGENLGMLVIDRATGSVDFFFDARSSSAARMSSEVRIGLEDATAIAKGFLEALGVDLEHFALESDPLVCVGMEGPPDNPTPVYSYEFYYRMQKDGMFVDGEGSCFVIISPLDGSIKSFGVPRRLISISNLKDEEIEISKEEAINIATEAVAGREVLEGTTPVVQTDGIELRYMLVGSSRLVPYWKVTVRYSMDNLANVKDIPEEAKYMGGCVYSVSAVDGQILGEESF
ncbi:MAG: hypothetical protein HPY75_06115 [Actinobacteria bacterium]|nr:hypothetical protein [Actinomycetota bacterium]